MRGDGTVRLTCPVCGASYETWRNRPKRRCSRPCYFTSRSSGTPKTFWATIDKAGPLPEQRPELGPCWLWRGGVYSNGYGMAYYGVGQRHLAHRLAWELANGPVPAGHWVLHHCDVRRCCNPRHLYLGTGTDNNNDMWGRGRRSHSVRLTVDQVRYARSEYARRTGASEPTYSAALYALADELRVSPTTIYDVVARRTWKHL